MVPLGEGAAEGEGGGWERGSRETLRLTKFSHFDGFFGGICNLKDVAGHRWSQPGEAQRGKRIDDVKESASGAMNPSRRNPTLEAFS